jgi:hypothetical protein
MKKSLMIFSALIALPIGVAVAGPDCKTKCAKAATAVAAKSECPKTQCDKAAVVAKADCAEGECDKAALVVTDCNFKCDKSVAKLFSTLDKDQDGKLDKAEFMVLVKAMNAKKTTAVSDKSTAAK